MKKRTPHVVTYADRDSARDPFRVLMIFTTLVVLVLIVGGLL